MKENESKRLQSWRSEPSAEYVIYVICALIGWNIQILLLSFDVVDENGKLHSLWENLVIFMFRFR